ncbi:Alpha/Beta hydrolase protein [Chytriomyces sp. MP71]|nr:Alpha/Beta hydrolase protein [Chytriomyces sp. MP71]
MTNIPREIQVNGRTLWSTIQSPAIVSAAPSTRIILVNGFRSSFRASKKADALAHFATHTLQTHFATYDHAGHGANPHMPFHECTATLWKQDLIAFLDHEAVASRDACARHVLVGSSMGLHLCLLAARARPHRVAGIVGVAGAVNFDGLVRGFDEHCREGSDVWMRPSAYNESGFYPIHRSFVESVRASENRVGEAGAVTVPGPVVLVHGMADEDVHYSAAVGIANRVIDSPSLEVVLIKGGDHRLSKPAELDVIQGAILRVFQIATHQNK